MPTSGPMDSAHAPTLQLYKPGYQMLTSGLIAIAHMPIFAVTAQVLDADKWANG